jgi:hypothetical protein
MLKINKGDNEMIEIIYQKEKEFPVRIFLNSHFSDFTKKATIELRDKLNKIIKVMENETIDNWIEK